MQIEQWRSKPWNVSDPLTYFIELLVQQSSNQTSLVIFLLYFGVLHFLYSNANISITLFDVGFYYDKFQEIGKVNRFFNYRHKSFSFHIDDMIQLTTRSDFSYGIHSWLISWYEGVTNFSGIYNFVYLHYHDQEISSPSRRYWQLLPFKCTLGTLHKIDLSVGFSSVNRYLPPKKSAAYLSLG